MKPISYKYLLLIMAGIISSNFISSRVFAFGKKGVDVSSTACFDASQEIRNQAASQIVQYVMNSNSLKNKPENFSDSERKNFAKGIGMAMLKLDCAFADEAKFDSMENSLDAIANKSRKINERDVPAWMTIPGFKAVLAGVDSDNTIYIESSNHGLIYHACQGDDGIFTVKAPAPSASCPTMLNSSVVMPMERMLKKTNGLEHFLLVTIKVAGAAGVIITSDLNLGLVSIAAQATSTMISPDPLSVIQRDEKVQTATRQLLEFGGQVAADGHISDGVVTQILPYKYNELKEALVDLTEKIFEEEFKDLQLYEKDPYNPNYQELAGLQDERRFHDLVSAEIKAAAAQSAAPATPEAVAK